MSLRSLRNAAVFSRAQERYDATCPPEDDTCLCPECLGDKRDEFGEPCIFCGGLGYYFDEPVNLTAGRDYR